MATGFHNEMGVSPKSGPLPVHDENQNLDYPLKTALDLLYRTGLAILEYHAKEDHSHALLSMIRGPAFH